MPDGATPNDGSPSIMRAVPCSLDGDGPSGTQPATKADLEMGQDEASQIDPMPSHPDLLEAARHHALWTYNAKDLRILIRLLEDACETARVAAIGALQDPARQSGVDESTDHNFGFADLFAALRRARVELASREFGRPERVRSKSPRVSRSVSAPAVSLRAAILAQHKARQ